MRWPWPPADRERSGLRPVRPRWASRPPGPGYDPGDADGVLSPETREAVRAFQAKQWLTVDGEFYVDLLKAVAATG